MKVLRDAFTAVLVGIMGGILFSTISYYHHHKEGGLFQTMFAVMNSFQTVAQAYAPAGAGIQPAGLNLSDQVAAAFEQIENGEEPELAEGVLKLLPSLESGQEMESDVLAMQGEDGQVKTGAPYSGIIRFHVRANSDSQADQELKLAVRDDVISLLKPILSECGSVAESRRTILRNLQNIYTTCVDTITEQGYDYPVKVYLTQEEFPEKTYGELTFPEGEYQALRIDIGEAKGQNWWCVMYPPLCLIDGTTAVITEEGKEELARALTPEEYMALFGNREENGVTVKGKSKLFEWIREFKN